MLDICTLHPLYLNQVRGSSSPLDQAIYRFILKKEIPPADIVDLFQWQEASSSDERVIANWRRLLILNLLGALTNQFQNELVAKIHEFERHPWNRSSQYFRSIVALNHALVKMPIPEVGPHLLESGAALIDLHEYCPWLALPYTPHHFEFGLYLCMLALMTKRSDLKENVLRIANWQINTLDIESHPLSGLFVREKEGNTLRHLCLSYLFFRGAAALSGDNPFKTLAQASNEALHALIKKTGEKLDPLYVLVERYLNEYPILQDSPTDLPEYIYDPSTAMVGYRSKEQHVLCTLHGEHTGLGSIRYGDVEIVNYGPQYLPLGDCAGFGIEGNALSDQGIRRSMVEWRRGSFILKGCARMVDHPSDSSAIMGNFRGIWLEVTQEFRKPHFHLQASFLGLDGWDSVAFSFFVKGLRCNMPGKILKPRTLDRYEGEKQTILLEGETSSLEIRPLSFEGTMLVIPLAGDDSFWGADFLIAYLVSPDQRSYEWHIAAPK